MAARIQVQPKNPKAGDIVEVRIIIGHPMESGLRRDDMGRRVQRNIVNKLSCRYLDREIFRVELGPGIAANPYLTFFTRAVRSGELIFDWVDDDGERGSERATLDVQA